MKRLLASIIAPLLVCACSTSATVSTRMKQFEGKIVRGDERVVVVERDDGEEVRVERSRIVDVDHPGNVHLLLGSLIAAYGVANIAAGIGGCTDSSGRGAGVENSGAFCVGVFIPFAIGAGIALWGGVTHLGSTSALDSYTDGRKRDSRESLARVRGVESRR